MTKPLFDAEALIGMFENATAKQGEQVRKAVGDATLKALQARELSLKNIRSTLKSVTDAAGAGALKSPLPAPDVSSLLDKAVAGMDDALLRAVDANRTALATLLAQGADMRDKHLKKAIEEVEKLEDTLMGVVRKAAESATKGIDSNMAGAFGKMGGGLAEMWAPVLEKMGAGGTLSGASAASTVEQLMTQMQGTMRSTRAASLRAATALAESYAALASGVLIGMSEAMQQGRAAAVDDEDAPAAKPAAKRRR